MSLIALQCAFGFAPGANVATSNTGAVDLGAVDTNRVTLVGTDATTSFGSANNQYKIVTFASATPMTTSGNLVLRGVSSRTTTPGDVGFYVSDDAGVWNEVDYSSVNGVAGIKSMHTYGSNTTWTKDSGVTKILALAVGGGANGAAGVPFVGAGAGGGSGALVVKVVDVSSVNSAAVTVAANHDTTLGALVTAGGASGTSPGTGSGDFAVDGYAGGPGTSGDGTGGSGGGSLFFGYGAGGNGGDLSGGVGSPGGAGHAGVLIVLSF